MMRSYYYGKTAPARALNLSAMALAFPLKAKQEVVAQVKRIIPDSNVLLLQLHVSAMGQHGNFPNFTTCSNGLVGPAELAIIRDQRQGVSPGAPKLNTSDQPKKGPDR
jgi:hypothetical protein